MAHPEQYAFIAGVKARWPYHFTHSKVLEVGSYNVNGSVRELFSAPTLYIGLDVAPGRDVDVVCSGADYDTDVRFEVTISTECFEHTADWRRILHNMHRLTVPGGLVLFTCAANQRHEHGTPRTSPADSAMATEYYRNLNVKDFEQSLPLLDMFQWYGWEARYNDLYFYGVKR